MRGIAIFDETQVVFVDTPGLFEPRRHLDRLMVDTAWHGGRDADRVAFVIDASNARPDALELQLAELERMRKPAALVINKIDTIDQSKLLPLIAQVNDQARFEQTFPVSAKTGEGVDALVAYLRGAMPIGPWLYPEDQLSDLPLRMIAAELTREKIYERLHQELPYVSHVVTERWETIPKGQRVEQTIYVERESHKKIVLGRGGATIKWISTQARHAIAQAVDSPVHLFLFVKVRKNWTSDAALLHEFGIDGRA